MDLELAVEVTWPVDEAISTAMIFMSGQVQGGVLVIASLLMEADLSPRDRQHDVCVLAAVRVRHRAHELPEEGAANPRGPERRPGLSLERDATFVPKVPYFTVPFFAGARRSRAGAA